MSFSRSKSTRKHAAKKKKHANKMKRIELKKHDKKPLMKTNSKGVWVWVATGEPVHVS